MPTERLQVDTAATRSLSENVKVVHDALGNAASNSSALADHVGHPGLAGTVRDFADKWDDRRKELVEQLETLSANATAIADGFESVESELANALAGEG